MEALHAFSVAFHALTWGELLAVFVGCFLLLMIDVTCFSSAIDDGSDEW